MHIPTTGIHSRLLMLGGPWLFLFLQPLPHTAALRTLDLIWLLLAGAFALTRYRANIDWRSPLLRVITLLVGAFLLSAACGVAPLDSLNILRKDMLAPLLALLVLIATTDARRVWLVVITATAMGLAVRTLLVLTEWSFIPMPERLDARWVKGYAMDAVIYAPLILATVIVGVRSTWTRILLLALMLLQFAIVIAYESRTGMVALVAAVFTVAVLAGRRKFILAAGAVAIAMLATGVALKPQLVDRYAAVFSADSYRGPQGMSIRSSIWSGTLQLIEARPILGYGSGWKKMQEIARKDGYVAKWRRGSEMDKASADYFDVEGGSVNPHNLVLHILFEAGALGLIAYAALWYMFLACAAGAWKRRRQNIVLAWVGIAGAGFFIAYAVMNLMNGLGLMPGPIAGLLALAELSRRIGMEPANEN